MPLLKKLCLWRNGYSKLKSEKDQKDFNFFTPNPLLENSREKWVECSRKAEWVVDDSIIDHNVAEESPYAYVLFVDFQGGRIAAVVNEPPEPENLGEVESSHDGE